MIDFSQVYEYLDETVSFFENEAEPLAAQELTYRIIDRTKKGEDVNGSRFIPYATKYASYRKGWGYGTSPVDLYFLGTNTPDYPHTHMLESMQVINHALYFPEETLEIAIGNQVRREFFGANDSDWNAVAQRIATVYNEKFGRK
jgi:hypothetical protein